MSDRKFCFGYKNEPFLETILFFNDGSNSEAFEGAEILLSKTNCIEPKFFTQFYPYALDQSSFEVVSLLSFLFSEWETIAGRFEKSSQRCLQILLRNKEDPNYSLTYDLGSRSLLAVTTNGYEIMANGLVYEDRAIDEIRNDDTKIGKFGTPSSPPNKQVTSQSPIFDYERNKPGMDVETIVNGRYSNTFQSFFVRSVKNALKEIDSIEITDDTLFFPFSASSSFDQSKLTSFNFDDWFLLAIKVFTKPVNKIYSALIVNKENNDECIVLSAFSKKAYFVIANGVIFTINEVPTPENVVIQNVPIFEREIKQLKEVPPAKKESSETLLPSQNEKEPTPVDVIVANKPETIKPSTQDEEIKDDQAKGQETQKAEDNVINANAESIAETEQPELSCRSTAPNRRIYCTKRFLRSVKRAQSVYGRNLENRLSKIYQFLISAQDDDLNKWLKMRNCKKFHSDIDDYSIKKFVVSFTSPFTAHRIFYIQGSDCGRGIAPSSIVLLYYSNTAEHDDQSEIAESLSKQIDDAQLSELGIGESGRDDIDLSKNFTINQELYEVPFKKNSDPDEPSFNQYGVASIDQNTILKENSAPCIFSGSAGTGKTLMSVDLFKRFRETNPDESIVYVTYQPALSDQIQRTFDELGIEGKAYTFVSLAKEILGFNGNEEALSESHFYKWISEYVKTGEKKNVVGKISSSLEKASEIANVFFRGVIAGSEKNINRDGKPILTQNEFLDEVNDEMGISLEEKKAIYEVGKDYERHLLKHEELTDNGLALSLLSSNKHVFDAIIVDESQDLTEVQLYAILSLLKEGSAKIFLFGDDNQAINPSLFTLERARSCLVNKFGQGTKVPLCSLHEAYRSSSFLVQYINSFNKIKRNCIGHYGVENDKDEHSIRTEDEGLIPGIITSQPLIDSLINSSIPFAKDTIVITPSQEEKRNALLRYPNVDPRFFVTISEAKGREWDNTILYRFLSSQNDLWEGMLGEEKEGKKSTIHRMLFNRFYVALTRARNGILICEDSPSVLTRKLLLKSIKVITKPEEYESYFAGTIDDEDWYKYALSKYNDRQYEDALMCLSRIANIENTPKYASLHNDAENMSVFKEVTNNGSVTYSEEEINPIISTLLRRDDKAYLKKAYEMKKEPELIPLLNVNDSSPFAEAKKGLETIIKNKESLSLSEMTYFFNMVGEKYQSEIDRCCQKLNIPSKEEKENG